MIDNTTIDLAREKHFTKFSDAIKQELHTKLAYNQEIKQYVKQIDRIKQFKNTFSTITNSKG